MTYVNNLGSGKIIALVVFMALIGGAVGVEIANAAALTNISDTMSNETQSALATSTIKFKTPTGMTASQTFLIAFPPTFHFTGKTYTGLTMSYGASTGLENSVTLGASSAAGVVGAVFSGTNNATTTLTLASSGAGSSIPAGNFVVVTYNYVNQGTNPTSAGNYTIALGGGLSTAADSGTVTIPILTNSQVAVSATVPQSLTFSLGSNAVTLGTLSVGSVVSGSHTMTLATNGTSGASITVSGNTLTSGTNTITACAAGCTSTAGSAQFGLNLVANTSPSVGAAPSGSAPIGTAATNYSTANNFRFVSGDTVATAANPINTTTYTVSYIANIAGVTPAGSYSTSLTYNATANF